MPLRPSRPTTSPALREAPSTRSEKSPTVLLKLG